MKTLFAPGCALSRHRPGSIERISRFLLQRGIIDGVYQTCCKKTAPGDEELTLILCCPGCSHKFGMLWPKAHIVSLWKILLDTDFPFPDYHGEKMSIHDSCHARQRYSAEMQASARALCKKMNITVVEPEHTREITVCCGGSAPDPETRKKMAFARAAEFSEKDVIVYCTGCTRSFSITEKRPRHLLDLLFEEPT